MMLLGKGNDDFSFLFWMSEIPSDPLSPEKHLTSSGILNTPPPVSDVIYERPLIQNNTDKTVI